MKTGPCYSDPVIPLDTMISLDKHAQWHELSIDAQTVDLHSYHVHHRIWLHISTWNGCTCIKGACTRWLEAGLWRYSQASKCDVRCSGVGEPPPIIFPLLNFEEYWQHVFVSLMSATMTWLVSFVWQYPDWQTLLLLGYVTFIQNFAKVCCILQNCHVTL